MRHNLLTAREIVERTGISRVALQGYVACGLLPRPAVVASIGQRQSGQFDPAVLETIACIQALEQSGLNLDAIGSRLAADSARAPARPEMAHQGNLGGPDALKLTIEHGHHMAYLLNHRFEVQWLNGAARAGMPGFAGLRPTDTAGRSVFKLLLDGEPGADHIATLRMNLALARAMTPFTGIPYVTQDLPPDRLEQLRRYVDEATLPFGAAAGAPDRTPSGVMQLPLRMGGGDPADYIVHATRFRQGIFVVVSPAGDKSGNAALARLLARRDLALHSLLSQRQPVLTEIAVIAARLQDAGKICADLPPGEYLELVTQMWTATGEIFHAHGGVCVRGNGDLMAGYFVSRPGTDHVITAIRCALALKTAMAKLSKDWQLRKNWMTELNLNIGLNEAEEWLGFRHGPAGEEIMVQGDIVNHANRLANIARSGQIWAAKSFIAKLPPAQRDRLEFGIGRVTADGQRLRVHASYARVDTLLGGEPRRLDALREIAGIEVTEILGLRE